MLRLSLMPASGGDNLPRPLDHRGRSSTGAANRLLAFVCETRGFSASFEALTIEFNPTL
jgi:hypothetical protein